VEGRRRRKKGRRESEEEEEKKKGREEKSRSVLERGSLGAAKDGHGKGGVAA